MEQDPELRFQSAAGLEAALAALQHRHDRVWRQAAAVAGLVAVVALLAFVRTFVGQDSQPALPRTIRSIAVLPLINLSQDERQDFFADGMTDGVINTLGRVSALKVTARTSVMKFKGSQRSVAQIADELEVDAVLEGSAMLASTGSGAERVRVAVNLIDPRTQTQIWSDTFERDLDSVLSIQAEIARMITERIQIAITGDERRSLETGQRVDPEAYKLYLLGRQAWTKRTVPDLRRAIELFDQAVAKAPDYAPAHAGLADTYVLLTGDFGAFPRDEGAAKALASATKALALDPTLAEAHTSLAFTNFFLQWDWGAAEGHFRRALQLNPSYATAHHWFGNYLSDMGREDEALAEIRLALALDPLSSIISRDVAWPLFFGRKYKDAQEHLSRTLADHPGYLPAERLLARTYAQLGDTDEAVRLFESLKRRDDRARSRCELAWAYALAGRRADALRELASADQAALQVYPYDLALVYTALGQVDDAFAQLSRAFTEGDATMVNLKHDPRLDLLRSDARYGKLLALMRFPGQPLVTK